MANNPEAEIHITTEEKEKVQELVDFLDSEFHDLSDNAKVVFALVFKKKFMPNIREVNEKMKRNQDVKQAEKTTKH